MDFFLLQIIFLSGVIVEYEVGDDWLYYIYVRFFIFDEDMVEGLCGNFNGKVDDFIF